MLARFTRTWSGSYHIGKSIVKWLEIATSIMIFPRIVIVDDRELDPLVTMHKTFQYYMLEQLGNVFRGIGERPATKGG